MSHGHLCKRVFYVTAEVVEFTVFEVVEQTAFGDFHKVAYRCVFDDVVDICDGNLVSCEHTKHRLALLVLDRDSQRNACDGIVIYDFVGGLIHFVCLRKVSHNCRISDGITVQGRVVSDRFAVDYNVCAAVVFDIDIFTVLLGVEHVRSVASVRRVTINAGG